MIYPIPPGLWCVPSVLVALTGAPWDAVIHPALNRHNSRSAKAGDTLTGLVTGATISAALATLDELGYTARRYRGAHPHALVASWAAKAAARYPGRTLLLFTPQHALVASKGRVYDNHAPHGPAGADHPYARTRVESVYLVERRL